MLVVYVAVQWLVFGGVSSMVQTMFYAGMHLGAGGISVGVFWSVWLQLIRAHTECGNTVTTSWFWFKVPPGFNIVVCTCIGSNGFHLSVLNKALASGGGSVVFRGRVLVLLLCYPSLPSVGKLTMVVVTIQGPPPNSYL